MGNCGLMVICSGEIAGREGVVCELRMVYQFGCQQSALEHRRRGRAASLRSFALRAAALLNAPERLRLALLRRELGLCCEHLHEGVGALLRTGPVSAKSGTNGRLRTTRHARLALRRLKSESLAEAAEILVQTWLLNLFGVPL